MKKGLKISIPILILVVLLLLSSSVEPWLFTT